MSLGWSSPIIPKLKDPDQTPLPDIITDTQASWVGSVLFIGTIAGPLIGSNISNLKGRKACLFLGAVTTTISFMMAALAKSLYLIYAARVVMGFGSGILYLTNLYYRDSIIEIASPHIRGTFLTITACFNTTGIFLTYVIAPYVSYAATCWIGFGVSLSSVVSIFFLPESPVFYAFNVYIGQTIVGITWGWSAPVIPKLEDPAQTPLPEVITEAQSSWVASVMYLGTLIGPYVGSYLSNFSGRKSCLLLSAVVAAASFMMAALAKNLYVIYAARILMGFGAGTIYIMNLVYLGEIASTNLRGIFLTITACFNTGGTFLVYVIAPFVSYSVTNWVGFGVSMAFVVSIFFIPESPVYYALIGNERKAEEVLKYLGRENEIEKIMSSEHKETSSKIEQWIEIFKIKSNRRALFITLTLFILQQASGVFALIFFITTIFELAGSSIEPQIATIYVGLSKVVASAISPWFVERAGRKSLLLISTMLTSLSLAVLGLYFFLDRIEHASVAKIGWLPLVSLITCFLAFEFGFGIIPGTLTGEMFRANVRSTGSTLTITVSWLFGFGVSTAFGYMVPALGADFTFWIYAGVTACAFVFSLFFVPETKGKTLSEIEEMLNR